MSFENMRRADDPHVDHVTAAIKLIESLPPIDLAIVATVDEVEQDGERVVATYRAGLPGSRRLRPLRVLVSALMRNGQEGLLEHLRDRMVDDLLEPAPETTRATAAEHPAAAIVTKLMLRDDGLVKHALEAGVRLDNHMADADKPAMWDASYPGLPFCGTGPDPIEALVMMGLCQASALKGHRDTIDQLRALLDKAGIAYPGSQPPGMEDAPGATDLPDPSGPPGTVVVQKDQTAAALFVNDGGKTHADGDTTGELAPPLGKSKGSKAPAKA